MNLLVRMRNPQDSQAWDEFVRIYQGAIYSTARQWGLQHADACDLVQSVLQSVASQVDTWEPRGSTGGFRKWLRQVTRHKVIDTLRSRQRRNPSIANSSWSWNQLPQSEDPDIALFELECQREMFQIAAQQVRNEFEERTWQSFWLNTVEGLSAIDVSTSLGISLGAVYVAKSRVLARLREEVLQMQRKEEA